MTMLSSFLFILPLKKRCIKQKDKDCTNVESFTSIDKANIECINRKKRYRK